jgi:hypothetical protein
MKEKNGILYLDLGKGEVDRRTAGWTDKQIHNYDRGQLISQLESAQVVLDTLRENVRDQENRMRDLERILRRKQELVEENYKPQE